jgi:ethanolamine utilization protein EutP (predicted NTPase)
MSEKKQIKDLWGWLNEITLHKTPIENISEESWEKWNSYIIHRYVSMDIRYIELVNYTQTIPYDNKQQIYNIYREVIPKTKTFFKYLKTNRKKKNIGVIEYIAKYFECSLGEAEEYMDLLRETGARRVLYDMGVNDKEVDKLLKNEQKN